MKEERGSEKYGDICWRYLELLVEDHLRELLLNLAKRQLHQSGDVRSLHTRVRLDYPADVLLKQHVVKRIQVCRDDRVCA